MQKRLTPEYSAAEPDEGKCYIDQTGGLHQTREAAIEANFRADLRRALEGYCDGLGAQDFNATTVHMALGYMAEFYPDYLRILVGDRDET